MSDRHDPYAVFKIENYRNYVFGWFCTLVGTRIQGVAIGWEIYQRTGEALALGMVGLVQAIPTILLAVPAGHLADAFNRRRVVTLSLFGMTLTSIGLAILSFSGGAVSVMYALLFLDSSAAMLGRPARTALLPQIVPREVFPNAVTWNTSMMQMAWVIGPAIGGFIIAFCVPAAYIVCATGSLLFITLLTRVQIVAPSDNAEKASLEVLLGGLKFLWKTRLVLSLMSLDMFAVLLGGAVYLLPIFAEEILNIGPTGFGYLNAAPAAGAFCMAILMAHLPPMKRAGRNLLLAIAGFGAATIVFGLSQNFWLSFAMLFLTGAFDNVSMVVRHTLVQLLTPDEMRGRVSAVNYVFVSASNDLGGLESGLVAHGFGPVVSVVSGGLGTIVVVFLTALGVPNLRSVGSLNRIQTDRVHGTKST